MNLNANNVRSEHLGHLGILATVIKKISLIEKIDARLPVAEEKGAKVSMGTRAAAMILNGLGFVNKRLYMHEQFFVDKPVAKLLGARITAENLNDDVLGRYLDQIYDYGTTKLFSEIAFEIGKEQGLIGKSRHLDTTSLSVTGDYDGNEDLPGVDIAYGYSKDKRPDLKQVMLSLTSSGASGIPIWMEALRGNSSDKKTLHETIRKIKAFQKQMNEADTDSIYVADATLYTPKQLLSVTDLAWLTRVPSTVKEARLLCEKAPALLEWDKLDDNYKMVNLQSEIRGIKQRWQLIYSSQANHKEKKTLEKKVAKELDAAKKEVKKLSASKFDCKEVAIDRATTLSKKFKFHAIEFTIKEKHAYAKKGRPKTNTEARNKHFMVTATIAVNQEAITKAANRCGRFILSTNVLEEKELPNDELLTLYKEQSEVERGFRFLKDPMFEVSSIYLKKTTRIEALMVIMVLCLMVYNIGQYQLREILIKNKETLPNQVKREVTNPTLRWVFQILDKISIVIIDDPPTHRIVTNVCSTSQKIIKLFGPIAMDIYDIK